MSNLIVEYLVPIDGTETFCNSKSALNNLLQINTSIKVINDIIQYSSTTITYRNEMYTVENYNKIFHLRFEIDENEIDIFEKFLREIREIIYKVSGNNMQVLWDGISNYYSVKAYPIFYKIENLMRKLLTKFMFINVGNDWDKDNIPHEVQKSIDNKKGNDTYNYLYKTDFIDLSDFLFNEYSNKPVKDLISNLKNNKEYNKDDYIPKSNWQRYFNEVVDCDNEFLKKRWKMLYDLRCKVAHNNKFDKNDYEKTIELVQAVEPKIVEAIDKLSKVTINNNEKKILTENIVSNINELIGKYIFEYNELEKNLIMYCKLLNIEKIKEPFLRNQIQLLYDNKFIDSDKYQTVLDLITFRNALIHQYNLDINQLPVDEYINKIQLMNTYMRLHINKLSF